MDRRVALIGFSFRLPQTSKETFWQDLVAEKDLITEVDPSRWSFDNHLHPDKNHPGSSYTFKAGSLGDISGFDAQFFGISPREASVMDPQQRYLLEMTWEAMEHAGVRPSTLKGSDCGVFVGISSIDYSYRMSDDLGVINSSTATGNTSSIASNRISYTFDLRGPSISMDTACSSSMVAFHQACQAIRSGEVTTAVTGGISLHLHPFGFIIFSKATMLSPDGRCKVFDESANGYVRSEGGGIFVLKDYDQAIADGDTIHAVIPASAVNTDGSKSGMTIPSCHAQTALMEQAYAQASINPDDVDYLEAHGTGTPVGDPIETRAIGNALGRKRKSPLPIGSVKSNLGHLEPASGVAGLAKALMVLKHRAVPATISMKNPNPDIKFDEWNIRVVDKLTPLKSEGTLTVGVNSFGFGGANAHVILQSHTTATPASTSPDTRVPLIVSGRSEQALKQNALNLANFIEQHPSESVYDIAWSCFTQRERLSDNYLLFAQSAPEAADLLKSLGSEERSETLPDNCFEGQGLSRTKGPVFVYSGNGCQWETMGKAMLASSDVFREAVNRVDSLFAKYADFSLVSELEGLNGDNRFEYTEIAQPALFAVQVGVTEFLKSRGITPQAVTGHSVGEVAAAWASGALSLEQAVQVIYYRSLCQGRTKGAGAMSAVGLSADDVASYLANTPDVCIAGSNSCRGVTLAGAPEQLAQIEAQLEAEKIFNIRLRLDYAFHSPAMDPIEQELTEVLEGLTPHQNTVPYISTVTGASLAGEALNAGYWWENIRKPVLFQPAIDHLLSEGFNCFIEVGAHPVLKSYLQDQVRENKGEAVLLSTLKRGSGSLEEMEQCAAAAIIAGAVETETWFPTAGSRVELPTYAWQHEPYWHPETVESYKLLQRYADHPLLGAPLPRQPLHWENQLDTLKTPWLADHQVGESVVFPGAGFMELALNAASHFRHSDNIEIEDLEIIAPLILDENPSKVIQTRTDVNSGCTEILSRTHSASEQWTLNCKARAIHQPTGSALKPLAPVLPQRRPDFGSMEHQQLALQAGLQYGPAFSAVDSGWVEQDTIIAALNLPACIADQAEHYYLHPGVLDSAIQLVIHFLKDELERNSGTAFIPARAGRIQVKRSANTQPTLVRVKLLRKATHSLLTQFELFDTEGNMVARLDDVRFRAVRLYKAGSRETAYLSYHLTPASREMACSDSLQAQIKSAMAAAIEQEAEKIERFENEVAPLLESLISHAVAECFTQVAETLDTLDDISIESLNLTDPQHQNLRDQLLRFALEHSVLTRAEDGSYQLNPESQQSEIDSRLIWSTLTREYPDYFTAIHTAGRTALKLADAFLGTSSESENGHDISDYVKLFRDLLVQTAYPVLASALQQTLCTEQDSLPAGTRLRVLEVATSQAHFGHSICSQLNFGVSDYAFASSEPSAIETVEHLRERYPLAQAISIDSDKANLVAEAEPFHLALITLDHYCPQHNLTQLEQIKPLLAANATLLVCGSHPQAWMDFAFGNNPDWWLGDHSVQSTASEWLNALETQGFNNCSLLSSAEADSGFFMIACHWTGDAILSDDTPPASEHWLLVNEGTAKEQQLAEAIAQLPGEMSQIHASDLDHLPEILAAHSEASKPVTQIVGLSFIGENDTPLRSQTDRCAAATDIIQALEQSQSSAQLWLVTEGVGATLPCDQGNVYPVSPAVPADAAVWGFGRTLMNESLNNAVRLIDLPSTLTEEATAQFISELTQPSAEMELFIGPCGERLAPRLRQELAPSSAPVADDDNSQISLGFELPGQLRNLQWQAKQLPPLRDQEIEVEVKATGLNFRDIMYALGLLSDEAIENGFAGATMGLEFSGKVLRCGAGITQYQPGDSVVGFGSASFSNRLIATPYSVAPMPEGISFAAAATIPTTFLTVYYALHHLARLQPGERVLIHGAAGGVGIAAIQIAQWLGAEIYATVGSAEKREFLELMGVTRIYNSRELTFAEDILRDTPDGRGVDVVLNSLAGEAINQNFRVLKPFGRFLELGKRDFYENTHIGLRPFRNNISYFGIDADQLQQEQPALTEKLFSEVLALFADGTLFPLPYTQFNAHQVIDAFRYMQQAKQIGKIVVTYDEGLQADTQAASAQNQNLELDAEATYLVTGGLGGFGLKTAQWLVDRGAKHLLLVSRRGANSEEAQLFLQQCSANGIRVRAEACDVSDLEALRRVISLCGSEMPALKGVVHAATVINDCLIRNLDKEQIEQSLKAKLQGAANLDTLTRDLPLDMFILYSSATTLLGNPGQAAYVAANHWLEALCATRSALNLAGTCALWGAIDDVGFLARNEEVKDALQNRLGGNALSSDKGLQVLEQMILSDCRTLAIMELDWGSLSRFLPTSDQNKFREIALTADESDHAHEDSIDLEAMMAEMSETEFHAAVLEILTLELSQILMIPVDKIDPDKSIYDMGMDSLMGVELASALEARLGIQVPVMALTETPKLSQLTGKVISLIDKPDAADSADEKEAEIKRLATQHGTSTDTEITDKIVNSFATPDNDGE